MQHSKRRLLLDPRMSFCWCQVRHLGDLTWPSCFVGSFHGGQVPLPACNSPQPSKVMSWVARTN